MALSRAKVGLLYHFEKNRFNLFSQHPQSQENAVCQSITFSEAQFLRKMTREKCRVSGHYSLIDPGCFRAIKGLEYFVALPILTGEKLHGFVFLGFAGTRSLDSQELEFLDVFSRHVSSAMSHSETSNPR
jgi:hypothetical protein